MKGSHILTSITRTVKWIANYRDTEITRLQWKIDVGGLAFSSLLRGFENEISMKRMLIPIPMQVA